MTLPTSTAIDLDEVRISSRIPDVLRDGDRTWRRCGELHLDRGPSERQHAVAFAETTACYPIRRLNRYPNGDRVEDRGRGWGGGHVSFTIDGVTPG